MFSPTRRQLENGYGVYCSSTCDGEAHRIHPKPEERECAREGCDNRFVPEAWNLAHGWGRYCSRRCGWLGQSRPERGKGAWVACTLWTLVSSSRKIKKAMLDPTAETYDVELAAGLERCRRSVWRWDCELERDRGGKTGEKEGWFCSAECHAFHRQLFPWPGYRGAFVSPAASGGARAKMIGAREGRMNGRAGSRPVTYTADQAAEVRHLRDANPRLGQHELAKRVGITRAQVRSILNAA
jgi:hypothetical protein